MPNGVKKLTFLQEETYLRVLRLLEGNSQMNQRELAEKLNVSVGKVNYCLKALMKCGFIKAQSFRNSQNRIAYVYLLTPQGISQKTMLTRRFLDIKIAEYQALEQEIGALAKEIGEIEILGDHGITVRCEQLKASK